MNIARQAVKAWPRHDLASRQQINALRRGYIRARQVLGDKWLLSASVPRKQTGSADAWVLVGVCMCGLLGALL